MKSVLVPLDGSALADAALRHAEWLLGADPGEVRLVTVVPPGAAQGQASRARGHLEAIAERAAERGRRVSVVVREGDPAAEILAEVERTGPALVVMSSHGRSGVTRWVRGSVAERVLRCSPAPTLVLTPGALEGQVRPFRSILLAVDGPDTTAPEPAVLPLVEALAKRHGAEVVLVRVLTPLTLSTLFARDPAMRLRPIIERLEAQGIGVRAFGGYGDPASEILDSADYHGCDAIALTTGGRSGVGAWLHPSVTDKVLRHCARPLLVARASAPIAGSPGSRIGASTAQAGVTSDAQGDARVTPPGKTG